MQSVILCPPLGPASSGFNLLTIQCAFFSDFCIYVYADSAHNLKNRCAGRLFFFF